TAPGISREFFANYYVRNGATGYTAPTACGLDGSTMADVAIYKTGGHVYLITAAYGLGDVWELSGADSIVPKVKKVGRAANSKAAGYAGVGPYYGDEITFTSTSTATVPPSVNWTFTGDTTVY